MDQKLRCREDFSPLLVVLELVAAFLSSPFDSCSESLSSSSLLFRTCQCCPSLNQRSFAQESESHTLLTEKAGRGNVIIRPYLLMRSLPGKSAAVAARLFLYVLIVAFAHAA